MYSNVFTHTSAAGRGFREVGFHSIVSLCICRKCEMLAATTMRCQRQARSQLAVLATAGPSMALLTPSLLSALMPGPTDGRTDGRML